MASEHPEKKAIDRPPHGVANGPRWRNPPIVADAVAVFVRMPYGACLYTRMQFDVGAWEIAFLLREESRRMEQLGRLGALCYLGL